jgi:cytochrome P450 family 2 subfamily J
MKLLMEEQVAEHEATIDYNAAPRDFIDTVLVEMRRTTRTDSSFYGTRGQDNLVANLLDLFAAGSETTATTLSWAVLYMVREPAVQKRVQVRRRKGRPSMSSLPSTFFFQQKTVVEKSF